MPFTVMQLLCGLVVPAALAAIVAALLGALRAEAPWVWGLVLGAGFALAYWNLQTRPGWPPTANVLYLVFYFGVAAGILCFADGLFRPRTVVRIIVLVIAWRVAVRLLVTPQIPRSISPTDAEMWIDLSSLVTAVWVMAFEFLAQRAPGAAAPLVLGVISTASAIILALGWHCLGSGAIAGSLGMICLVGLFMGVFAPRIPLWRGFCEGIVLLLLLVLIHAYFYTDDTLTPVQETWVAILAAAPLLALLGDLPILRDRKPSLRLAVRVIPVLIALGIICGATIHDYVHSDQSQQMEE